MPANRVPQQASGRVRKTVLCPVVLSLIPSRSTFPLLEPVTKFLGPEGLREEARLIQEQNSLDAQGRYFANFLLAVRS